MRGTFEEALIIGLPSDDHTDNERYYTALEFDKEISARTVSAAFADSGLNVVVQGQWYDESLRDQWLFLVEADAILGDDLPGLKNMLDKNDVSLKGIKKLGGYAVPFSTEELA